MVDVKVKDDADNRRLMQRRESSKRREYVRLLEQLEFLVRNKVDTTKALAELDALRRL